MCLIVPVPRDNLETCHGDWKAHIMCWREPEENASKEKHRNDSTKPVPIPATKHQRNGLVSFENKMLSSWLLASWWEWRRMPFGQETSQVLSTLAQRPPWAEGAKSTPNSRIKMENIHYYPKLDVWSSFQWMTLWNQSFIASIVDRYLEILQSAYDLVYRSFFHLTKLISLVGRTVLTI